MQSSQASPQIEPNSTAVTAEIAIGSLSLITTLVFMRSNINRVRQITKDYRQLSTMQLTPSVDLNPYIKKGDAIIIPNLTTKPGPELFKKYSKYITKINEKKENILVSYQQLSDSFEAQCVHQRNTFKVHCESFYPFVSHSILINNIRLTQLNKAKQLHKKLQMMAIGYVGYDGKQKRWQMQPYFLASTTDQFFQIWDDLLRVYFFKFVMQGVMAGVAFCLLHHNIEVIHSWMEEKIKLASEWSKKIKQQTQSKQQKDTKEVK